MASHSSTAERAKSSNLAQMVRPRHHFSIEWWLSVAKVQVQFAGHRYICDKLEDFALSAVKEWLAIQCH